MGTEADLGLWVVLAGVPLLLALATSFTKCTVVLGALRVGLGAEALIPLPAVLAIALLVTAMVMAPVATAMAGVLEGGGGVDAYASGPLSGWAPVLEPLRGFLERHASAAELEFFSDLQGRASSDPLVLVPAFLVTELTEAFQIVVFVVVPFLLIDLVAAQALGLMGILQQPLPLLTLPVKLLLFLAVGGWDVILGGLVAGYQ